MKHCLSNNRSWAEGTVWSS